MMGFMYITVFWNALSSVSLSHWSRGGGLYHIIFSLTSPSFKFFLPYLVQKPFKPSNRPREEPDYRTQSRHYLTN
jgi:hypothetical protein